MLLIYNKPSFKFSDIVKNTNIFQKGGRVIFTGGLVEDVYLKVHKFIEDYFYDYEILLDRQTFIRLFQLKLIEIEFYFFNKLKMIYLKDLNDYLKPYNITINLGDFENSLKSTTSNHSEFDSTTNTNTDNNTTSNTFNRSISSELPQSNVKNFLGGSPKDNYNWNYASGVVDAVGDGTTNTISNGNNITSNNSDTERQLSDNSKGFARSLKLQNFNEDVYNLIKIINVINDNEDLYMFLINKLAILFDY